MVVFFGVGGGSIYRMDGLENMWSRFSLNEEEESSAEVSKDDVKEINRLVGWFFTRWC